MSPTLARQASPKAPMVARAALSIAALTLIACFSTSSAVHAAVTNRETIQSAIRKVEPALVRIRVVEADYRDGREVKSEAAGSGVIISPQGYIVTNHHVAGNAVGLMVTLADKEEIRAKLVGTDPLADIAVVKLEGVSGRKYPWAHFGDSSHVKVGERVLAMGSPLALSQSVTQGIVSNVEMIMPAFLWPFNRLTLSGEDVGSMVRWIGHDAQISPGNSGGPLVNLDGQIIGINEIQFGLSGAIPSNLVQHVADQLIKYGHVQRSWLGLEVQPLLKASPIKTGALVSDVISGSPAEKSGLKSGDIILKMNGKPVSVRFAEQVPIFNQTAADLPVGKAVRLLVLRGSKQITLQPVTRQREPVEPKEQEFKDWGITARNISLMMQKEMELSSREGAVVTSVAQGGQAEDAKPPLQEGDVIVKVASKPVTSTKDLAAVTSTILAGKKGRIPALVEFTRQHGRYLTVVRVGKEQLPNPGLDAAKAWLPIRMQVLTPDLADALGLPGKQGVRVTEVYKNHSAAKAGVKVGDVIVALDGDPVDASQPEDTEVLPAMVREKPIGEMADFTVLRDGKQMDLKVELEASPKSPREMKRYRNDEFQFTVRDLTFADRSERRVSPAPGGVVVESVDEGGWAALGRLALGDIITQINGHPIASVDDVRTQMELIQKQKPASVVFHVVRGIHELFVEVQPTWPKS